MAKIEIDADLQDLIPQFIDNRKKDIELLQEFIDKKDFVEIAQLAHKLKGSAAGYGFKELSSMAAQLETAAKAQKTQDLPKLASEMKSHINNIEIHFVII